MKVKNKRLRLWLHLASEHAAVTDPFLSLGLLELVHDREHEGPGWWRSRAGVLDHGVTLRGYDLKKVGRVLSEAP